MYDIFNAVFQSQIKNKQNWKKIRTRLLRENKITYNLKHLGSCWDIM